MNKKEKEIAEAIATLKEWGVDETVPIYSRVTHVARSGMSRNIVLEMVKDGQLTDISYWGAKALEWPYKDGYNGGIRVSGCGMDMCLHTVDTLSYVMGYGPCNQSPRARPEATGLKWYR